MKIDEIKSLDAKLELKDVKSAIASTLPTPDSSESKPTDYYTRDEVHTIVSNIMDHVYSMFNSLHDFHNDNHNHFVKAVNKCNAEHADGHLPKMHPGQVKSVLTAAGIAQDFADPKPSMECDSGYIYASKLAPLTQIKIEVK